MDESFAFDGSSKPLLPKYNLPNKPADKSYNSSDQPHPSEIMGWIRRSVLFIQSEFNCLCVYLGIY
jgi:hypothetical protein